MKIGFIGLGNMGAPMAQNLAAAGHDVVGFDTAAITVEGTTIAASAIEAARGADVVITMLPNGGPHRMCPLATSSTQQRSGTIQLRELNAVPQTTASSAISGLQTRSGLNAGATFSVSGVPQADGQPQPLKLTLANPECRGWPG